MTRDEKRFWQTFCIVAIIIATIVAPATVDVAQAIVDNNISLKRIMYEFDILFGIRG